MKPFSIIVPVYNEAELLAENTARLVDYCRKLEIPFEILLVSNGSTDETLQIGPRLTVEFPEVRFFTLAEKGVGRAFKKGINEARYEHIIFMDADLSAELSFIALANQQLESNALVLGTKLNGLQNRSLFRKMGSFVFYLSVLILMRMKYVDYAPGAKAYRKSFLQKYFSYIDDYTSFVLNLAFIATLKKEPVVEIPITCNDNRQSRFNLWQEAGSKYKGLLSLKLKQLLGRL